MYSVYDCGGALESDVWYADHQPITPPMYDKLSPHASTRPVHAHHREPTWRALALSVGFAALIPLTLFALAHPMVVAAVAGTSIGLLARPLHHRLTHQSA